MKKHKLFYPRFPWWTFDFINERKGFWKKLHHRIARQKIKNEIRKEVQ